MSAITRIAAAALIGTGFATIAPAPAGADPLLTGAGPDAIVFAPHPHNIVGGALSRVVGSGESATVEILWVQHTQPPRVPRITGSGVDTTLSYDDPAPEPTRRLARAGRRE